MTPGAFCLSEPCCGTAAVSLSYIKKAKLPVPYQGNKWRLRRALQKLLAEHGFTQPVQVQLNDLGPWGRVWEVLTQPDGPALVATVLEEFVAGDPRVVYDSLQGHAMSQQAPPRMAAEFLFLQRLAFSGKAVGVREGKWRSAGFNTSTAYGLPGTERFGEVKPLVPRLLEIVKSMETWVWPQHGVTASQVDAVDLVPPATAFPIVCYLDPPYARRKTRYLVEMGRDQTVHVARRWHEVYGAFVIVSESEPVNELCSLGWESTLLRRGGGHQAAFRAGQDEFVTCSPPLPSEPAT